jgi:SAM-dependent methyltransferase
LWRFLEEKTDFFQLRDVRMLHVAPEALLETRFRKQLGAGYLSADFLQPADVKMDITDIQYPEDSFDVVYCSHVLEHVPDDRQAMRELCRVLKPSGWAILLVPVTVDSTIEDPTITDPQERLRLFGQDDHVRRYGPDFVDRLREAGFNVTTTSAADFLSLEERSRIAVDQPAAGDVFYCRKPGALPSGAGR